MDDLRDRKNAMEDKYFQDAERSLRVQSRGDRLLANWIAGLIGLDDIASYAAEITDIRLKGGGEDGVLSKALSDIQAAGHNFSKQDLAAKVQELKNQATAEL